MPIDGAHMPLPGADCTAHSASQATVASSLSATLSATLAALAARVFDRAVDSRVSRSIAVAYSGGLDSSVLLHHVHAFAAAHGIRLHAFHVHHGLAPEADAWLAHCQGQAAERGIAFDACRIDVDIDSGAGIEASARTARYAALGAMCRAHGVPLLLTAHHQDDQAETVLLQLLRGSGVAGLSGMDEVNTAPALLGNAELLMARPLLAVPRVLLQEEATVHGIAHVEDPSNRDPRFARNALRHQVMPAIESAFPGFAGRFARTARHAQAAQQLLVELAALDFAACSDGAEDEDSHGNGNGKTIDLAKLQRLSDARIDNLLRYWFGLRGMRMPSTAWLQELCSQLFGAKADAQLLVGHADCDIHRHRHRIVMTPRRAPPDPEQAPTAFAWNGEACLDFPTFGGRLHFEPAAQGVDSMWLQAQTLALQWRSGGWRLKLAPNRATRSLKYHYQAADVPAWERAHLPLVTVGPRLLYAAGIGMDCHHFSDGAGERICLRWEPGSV